MTNGDDAETRQWTVRGRVQGVGFRMFVVQVANELELTGTVRNTRDGAVEVVAAGAADVLCQLEQRLHVGPEMADVQSVEAGIYDGDASEFFGRFMVVG